MNSRRRRPLETLGVAILVPLSFGPQEGLPYLVEGPRVSVRSSVPFRPAAERCRDLLGAALPLVESQLPYRLPEGDKLRLNLFRTKEEYAEAIREAGGERFVENQAFTSFGTKESYVVLQPRTEGKYLEMVGGLPELTKYLVVHEAVHQLVYRADAPNFKWLPDWYAEGMADLLAERCLAKEKGAAGLPILFEHKRELVQDLLEKQGGLELESLLELTTFTGGVSQSEAYAAFYSLFRFLAADAKKLEKLHGGIRGLGGPGSPGQGMPDDRASKHGKACTKVLAEIFGPLKGLQTRWSQEVKKQPGAWFEHSRSSERRGVEIVCAAFPESNAILVSGSPAAKGDFRLEGEVNFSGIGKRQADLYLDFERGKDLRFLEIAIGVGSEGFVTLLPYSNGGWQESLRSNVAAPAELFPVETWIPFQLGVKGKSMRLEVAGKTKAEFSVPAGFGGRLGAWGVGSKEGVVRFRNLKVK